MNEKRNSTTAPKLTARLQEFERFDLDLIVEISLIKTSDINIPSIIIKIIIRNMVFYKLNKYGHLPTPTENPQIDLAADKA